MFHARNAPSMRNPPTLLSALLLAATALPGARHAAAQTVQPAITEYTGKGSGSFIISNDLPVPIFVSIQPQSFTIDPSGKALYVPLAKTIHLSLSTTSLRLPPKQSRTIYYEATADQLPAWFTIYSTLMGVPGRQGVSVQLRLPHTVYLLPKTKVPRSAITFRNPSPASGATEPGTLSADIVNAGDGFIRAKEVEVLTTRGKKLSFGGFPLLPHSHRTLALPIGTAQPSRITVKFNDFSLEEPFPTPPQSGAPGAP